MCKQVNTEFWKDPVKKRRICMNDGARDVIFILDTTSYHVKLCPQSKILLKLEKMEKKLKTYSSTEEKRLVVGEVNFLCVRMIEGYDYGI